MKFLDQITGRSELKQEIEKQKLQIDTLQREKKNLQIKVKELANLNFELKELNKKQLDQIKKLAFEIDSVNEQIKVYEHQLSSLDSYKLTYGEISVNNQPKKFSSVSPLDEDSSFFEFLLSKNDNNPFNEDQVSAIRYDMKKHLRIIAGAGSGKTQTICAKAAYLTMMENVPENKIAMITFTNKAAEEMAVRVKMFSDNENSQIKIGTFHKIFKQIYEELKSKFPYVETMGINGDDEPTRGQKEYRKLLYSLIKKYGLKKLDDNGEKNLIERINYWTNMGFTFKDMAEFIKKHFDDLDNKTDHPLSERFFNMMNEFNTLRKEKRIVIFDDYLINLLNVLEEDASARDYVQNRFDYIFIDEFQDTNPLQMKILKLICPPNSDKSAKMIIVGDDDQSIYFFRGAEPKYIKTFDKIYETHTSTLMTNYRSTEHIVQAGNRVIAANSGDRIEKTMKPFHKENGDCFVKGFNNSDKEAEWIIKQIKDLGHKATPFKNMANIPNYTQSVVLYRSVGQLKNLFFALEQQQIPYVIESNEDLLGIFNIDKFKNDFKSWKSFMEATSTEKKKHTWNRVIEQTGYLFYKNKAQMNQFISKSKGFITAKVAAEFICSPKNTKYKNDVEKYLEVLIQIKNGSKSSLFELAELYLSFPLPKRQISTEESIWIQKELDSVKGWSELLAKYEKLTKKKDEMNQQLMDYHSGNLNALYLLTIHKSKGLSFPNVFLIGLHNEGLPSHRAIPKDNSMIQELIEKAEPPSTIEEERRLMYVAVTRPKKNLYITFPKMVNDKPCKRSIFLKEIDLPIK